MIKSNIVVVALVLGKKEMFGGEENEKKAIEWIFGDVIAH